MATLFSRFNWRGAYLLTLYKKSLFSSGQYDFTQTLRKAGICVLKCTLGLNSRITEMNLYFGILKCGPWPHLRGISPGQIKVAVIERWQYKWGRGSGWNLVIVWEVVIPGSYCSLRFWKCCSFLAVWCHLHGMWFFERLKRGVRGFFAVCIIILKLVKKNQWNKKKKWLAPKRIWTTCRNTFTIHFQRKKEKNYHLVLI